MAPSSSEGLQDGGGDDSWQIVAFHTAFAAMAVADASLRLLKRNWAFDALVGASGTSVSLLDLLEANDVEDVRRAAENLLTGVGRTWSAPVSMITGRQGRLMVNLSMTSASSAAGGVLTVQVQQLQRSSGGDPTGFNSTKKLITIAGQLGRFGVWRWHPRAGMLELSEQARVLLRAPEGPALPPAQAFRIFGTADRTRMLSALSAAIDEGSAFDLEFDEHSSDGVSLRVTGEPVWAVDGLVIEVEGALQDITESKRLRRQLLESERALQDLIGNLRGIVYRCANLPSWPLTFVSSGAKDLTGYTSGQLLAQHPSFGELIHSDDAERIWAEVQMALDAKRRFQVTYRIHCAQGETKFVWEQGCGIFASDGSMRWLEGFITDITEKEAAKEEVRRLNEELEAKVRKRTEQLQAANADMEAFGYSLAHDMRAPVAAVIGFAEALQAKESALEEKSARYLDRIVHNGRRMVEMIDGLLELARLSNPAFHRARVNMTALAEEAVLMLQELDPARPCEISVQPEMYADGDSRLLRQVFVNLVGNAWKFSRPKPVTRIWIRAEPREDRMVFSVADDGVGFERDERSDPFQPFKRLHDAQEFEGTGIGLSIVRKIVQRHGGTVWADSQPGSGATFHFTLGTGSMRASTQGPSKADTE